MRILKNHLIEMLKENTGSHFLDSGGAYGRKWQQNQSVDFENEPRVTFDIWSNNEVDETVSTYHYLNEVLSVDAISESITKLIVKNDIHWTGEFEEFINERQSFVIVNKIHYDIDIKSESINTYNYENNLSQVLQYMIIRVNNEPYVILQIHGGCDVRGGYTQARCFKLEGYLTGQVDVYGSIDGKEVSNTYNGYSLTYGDGSELDVNENSQISLDFYVMNEVYMYK